MKKHYVLIIALVLNILLITSCYNTVMVPIPIPTDKNEETETSGDIKTENIKNASNNLKILLDNLGGILDGTITVKPEKEKENPTTDLPVTIEAGSTLTMILPEKFQGWHWKIEFLEESSIDTNGNLNATLAFSYYKDNNGSDDISGPLGDISDNSSGLYGNDTKITFKNIPIYAERYDESNILVGNENTPLTTLQTTNNELYKQAVRTISGNTDYSILGVFWYQLTKVQDEKIFEELEPWEMIFKYHEITAYTFETDSSLPCILKIDDPSNGYLGVSLKTTDGLLEFSAEFYSDIHYIITKFIYDGNEYTESDALLLDIDGVTGEELLWSIADLMDSFNKNMKYGI